MHAFVGKGMVFDAGGLNIKPTGSMEDMYMDKAGACACLAAFNQIVEMKLNVLL
jgi:leucyl aminopeptidase